MRVAYIRVSSLDQNPDRQLRVDIEKNYIDKCSGSISFSERPEAKKLLLNTNVTEMGFNSTNFQELKKDKLKELLLQKKGVLMMAGRLELLKI